MCRIIECRIKEVRLYCDLVKIISEMKKSHTSSPTSKLDFYVCHITKTPVMSLSTSHNHFL
jgi:hypothetical protein